MACGLMVDCERAKEEAPLAGHCVLRSGGSASSSSDTYHLLEVLGQGTAGLVRRARRASDGLEVALKTTRAEDAERLAISSREFEVLRHVAHPSITRAMDFFSL